jgi:dTDP-glucose 4,6-dehydratase
LKKKDKKRVLITGGAGFIGSHLAEFLLHKGFSVICMDNLITGSIDNISSLYNKDFLFINHDVTNYIFIDKDLDYILHFASPASPVDYLEYPIQTLKVGSLGTHKTLGLAKDKKATFLLASTSEVYGDPQVHPQAETYWGNVNPIGPRGVYDEAKRFAEALTVAYHRYHNVEIRIARIFNTYGPRMRLNDGRAIPTFIAQALQGKDITVYGDGKQTRSFCYISDLIDGLYRLMVSDYSWPINLGNPAEKNILELAEIILKLTESKSRIVFCPLPEDDPKVRQPENSLAQKMLKWEPRVSLEDGLKETIKYFKKILKE